MQAPMPAAPTPGTYTQGQQSRQGAQQPPAAYQSQSNQSSNSMHHAMVRPQSGSHTWEQDLLHHFNRKETMLTACVDGL